MPDLLIVANVEGKLSPSASGRLQTIDPTLYKQPPSMALVPGRGFGESRYFHPSLMAVIDVLNHLTFGDLTRMGNHQRGTSQCHPPLERFPEGHPGGHW
jgi:hypothetical protein